MTSKEIFGCAGSRKRSGVTFTDAFLADPLSFDPDLHRLEVSPWKPVHFLVAIPAFTVDMTFKMQSGTRLIP